VTNSELTQLAFLVAGFRVAPTKGHICELLDRVVAFNGPLPRPVRRQVRGLLGALPKSPDSILSRAVWLGVKQRLARQGYQDAARAVSAWVCMEM
jgi:ATP-dependent exoDNAse (exonuclease V) alpha subunit